MASARAFLLPFLCSAVGFVVIAEAHSFLRAGRVDKEVMTAILEGEIMQSVEMTRRTEEWRKFFLPVFNVMPKNKYGNVGHQAARYILHRGFSNRYGWFIRGLEPGNASWQGRPWEGKDENEWVPDFLQNNLEKQRGEMGVDFISLLAFANTLEDLIDKETEGRLQMAFKIHGLPVRTNLELEVVRSITRTYLVSYMMGGNLSVVDHADMEQFKADFAATDSDWPAVAAWIEDFEAQNYQPDERGHHTFQSLFTFLTKVGQMHHSIFNKDCQALKTTFQEAEPFKPGRMKLSTFYEKGKEGRWDFEEKVDYLRTLGTLDESNPDDLQIISTNYIMSRVNCMEPSDIYVVCCRNECEDLMSHIEGSISGSWASPKEIAELVAALPSDTVEAPRKLGATLLGRLDRVAAANGGRVPIHGRLFAQWMHHAYPRECPYPHPAGTVSPLTPSEWMQETGDTSKASSEEIDAFIAESKANCSKVGQEGQVGDSDLPWTEDEELIVVYGKNHQSADLAETTAEATLHQAVGSPKLDMLAATSAAFLLFFTVLEYCFKLSKTQAAAFEVLATQDPQLRRQLHENFRVSAGTWLAVSAAWYLDVLDSSIFALAMAAGLVMLIFRQFAFVMKGGKM